MKPTEHAVQSRASWGLKRPAGHGAQPVAPTGAPTAGSGVNLPTSQIEQAELFLV